MDTGETARPMAAIITVHGTGDTAEGPDGAKWYQRGSAFSGWLLEELSARGVEAEIHPLLWSGANSASQREEASEALAKRVKELAREHESVHIIGHSHGGNVANDAAAILNWAGGKAGGTRAKDRLRSISTVGTPFFRSDVNNAQRFGGYGFLAMAVISATLVVALLAAPKSLLGLVTDSDWTTVEGEIAKFQDALSMWLTGVGVAGLVALAFIIPIAWKGLLRIRRAGRRRPKARIFSLWHGLDEAISFLQRVESLPIEPFSPGTFARASRTSAVLWGVRAVFFLPALGLLMLGANLALSADWALGRWFDGTPEYPPNGFGPSSLEALAQQVLLFGVAGAPVIFGAVYLLYRAFALTFLERVARGPLNRRVGGALKGIAFGKDGDHALGGVSSRSHRFSTEPHLLAGEIEERLRVDAMAARQALFMKYESGVFSVDADQNEIVQEIAEDALTWDALIHTTYFDHREVAGALAGHVADRLAGRDGAATLLPPAGTNDQTGFITRLFSSTRSFGLGMAGLGATSVVLLAAVAYLAVLAGPALNKDHLVDAPQPLVPPAAFLTVIEKGEDCADCPEMVVLPGGTFSMGSPTTELVRGQNEGPMRRVTVQPFAVGKFEVTYAEWDACIADGGCGGYRPNDQGWGRGARPVISVSWQNAQMYVSWLNGKVEGAPYRLLTEAEWEYAARAGTISAYWWGDEASPEYANYSDTGLRRTARVGSYDANPFGLHDMHGNVYEWVEDCYRGNPGLPSSEDEANDTECRRVLRGGSWVNGSVNLRSAGRIRFTPTYRSGSFGFRLARTL